MVILLFSFLMQCLGRTGEEGHAVIQHHAHQVVTLLAVA
jgi:hypothetical protein